MFGKLKFSVAFTIGAILALTVLVACGGASATEGNSHRRNLRPCATSHAAGRFSRSRHRRRSRRLLPPPLPSRGPRHPPVGAVGPTATPSAISEPGGETVYSESAKLLMSGGASALAGATANRPGKAAYCWPTTGSLYPSMICTRHPSAVSTLSRLQRTTGFWLPVPYDPLALEIIPDLARTWDLSDGGSTATFHLAEGVKWHDGAPFSSEDVKYTIERIKDPPKGMVSPRQGVFRGTLAVVETPDPNTVVVKSDGASPLLVPLFSNGWNAIIPKHISEVDPVNAMMTQVIGTGAFKLREPPTTTLWRYDRNPEYFEDGLPYIDEIEYQIIQDAQSQAAALLPRRFTSTMPSSESI